ncbi:hypothetical protein NKW43_12330 [Gluconobacter albidus]|uniref:hypothetical protein n=1 Tax=Gluconobacter TaxID=441 RepID=UPI0020117263|nr:MULTISPECIES: hypothetical protein [Gluconobacter]MCP1274463.1 hypothetical protein [Gluconobacter albidus]
MFVILPPDLVQSVPARPKAVLTETAFEISHAPLPLSSPAPSGPVSLAPPAQPSVQADPPKVVHHFCMTSGYGHQVPLSFAVRQIVPSGVRVTYGAGVDPGEAVDWQGGREWNKVLATTVSPLGERIEVGRAHVTILKK